MLQMLNMKNSFKTYTISEMWMTQPELEEKMFITLCLSITLNQSKGEGRMQKTALHYKK